MSWGGQQPPGYNPYGAPQQQGYGAPAGYGAPGGYGAPPRGAAPPAGQQQYGAPGGYAPPPQGNVPPPAGYVPPGGVPGARPPATAPGYQAPGYGAPAGYGAAPQGYGGAPPGGAFGAPAGYGAPPSQPPPGVAPDLWQWFQAVDQDRSGQITAAELRNALLNANMTPFNPETCRLMIGMFDRDRRDGKINIHEFTALWKYIQDWKACFDRFDTDRSGNINQSELQNAFQTFGYNLSPQFTHMVILKFDRYNRRSINFDDFIQSCVMLKSLTDSFRAKDASQQGVVNIQYEEFLRMVLDNS